MNDERGGNDGALVEEVEMRSRTSPVYVNENDDYVGELDASTCSSDIFNDDFEKER